MNELIRWSFEFFGIITGLAVLIFITRTAPITLGAGGLYRTNFSIWLADQIQTKIGIDRESFLTRISKLTIIVTKYGLLAWALYNGTPESITFWNLVWLSILTLELLRKTTQIYVPERWENVSLKFDSEHFWHMNLIVAGVIESYIQTKYPVAVITLLGSYLVFSGESKESLFNSFEEVISIALALVALLSLANFQYQENLIYYYILGLVLFSRGIVRFVAGRVWIRKKFWWIAQFCLMSALIIKAIFLLGMDKI